MKRHLPARFRWMQVNADVRTALSAGFPGREVATVAEQSGSEQSGNRMVAVRFQDGEQVFLKIATDGDSQRITRDTAATRYARAHCDIRVPRVVVADLNADQSYVATTPLSGISVSHRWDTAALDERTAVLRQVGRGLAGIHAAQFDRSGRVVGGGANELALDRGSWTDVLCEDIERRAMGHIPDRFEDVLSQVCQNLRKHHVYLDDVSTALLHGDPRPENCFLDGQPGFIDWETALVGDPVLDLCYAENQYIERPGVTATDRLYRALRRGYREYTGGLPDGFEARRPIYRVVTFLLLQVTTFDYWAPGTNEPTEELAEWVKEEIDRRIDRLQE